MTKPENLTIALPTAELLAETASLQIYGGREGIEPFASKSLSKCDENDGNCGCTNNGNCVAGCACPIEPPKSISTCF